MGKPTSEDLRFLNENFDRFGQDWQGGLAALEERFRVEVVKKWRSFEIQLETRSVARLRSVITIRRKDGRMSQTRPELPAGRELVAAELERVEQVLARIGELWLIGPMNERVWCLPLDGGLAGLCADPFFRDGWVGAGDTDPQPRKLRTRWLESKAGLYLSDPEWGGDLFTLALDLDAATVLEAGFFDLQPASGGMLTAERMAFFDQSLRTHGDFGVYGDLTPGFAWLVEHFDVSVRETEQFFEFSADPPDGHGHFFQFAIDKTSGKIDGVACGHNDPMPHLSE